MAHPAASLDAYSAAVESAGIDASFDLLHDSVIGRAADVTEALTELGAVHVLGQITHGGQDLCFGNAGCEPMLCRAGTVDIRREQGAEPGAGAVGGNIGEAEA